MPRLDHWSNVGSSTWDIYDAAGIPQAQTCETDADQLVRGRSHFRPGLHLNAHIILKAR